MNRIKLTQYLLGAFVVLLLSLTQARAYSGEAVDTKQDSIKHFTSIYFATNKSISIDSMDSKQIDFLVSLVKKHGGASVRVEGWADKAGDVNYNKMLSQKRADRAKSFLIESGVVESSITAIGMGVDVDAKFREARRATIYVAVPAPPKPKTGGPKTPAPAPKAKPEPKPEPKPEVRQEPAPEPVAIEEPVIETEKGKFALRTNLLYWLGASMNLGFEWNPASTNFGVILNGGYAPLGGDNWKHNMGGWFVSPELRYYLGKTKQWFLGAEFLVGGYNFNLSNEGYQGYTLAGGITGGYKITLNKNFDMDFSLGLGYGTLNFDKYYHCDDCDLNIRRENNVHKSTLMPIQAGVSLIWKIR